MPSFFRRAGAQILRVLKTLVAPAAQVGEVQVFAMDVAGVTQLFVRAGDGTISQLSPVVTVQTVELDFGSVPVASAQFTVTDATVAAASKLVIVQAGTAATGRDADEAELDPIAATASPGDGQFTVFCAPLMGRVVGKYKFHYQVGL